MKAARTVVAAIAFTGVLILWTVAYIAEGALDKLLVLIVGAFPEED